MDSESSANDNDMDNDGDIAVEDTVNQESTAPSPTPKDIRITQKNYSLREIYFQLTDKELDLTPDFQRAFVWSLKQQVRLIESILMGIPLPVFYFNQDKTGTKQVVDGVQRLTTIKLFISNQLALKKDFLDSITDVAGQTFETLDNATKRRFFNTQIVAYIIEPQTPDTLKYDIFNRVNTIGSPLTPQEIRHCLTKDRSRQFLQKLVELPSFDIATSHRFWNGSERDNKRMVNRELALRFCAFYIDPLDEYRDAVSLDSYLLNFSQRLDQVDIINAPKLAQLHAAFDQAMQNAHALLGSRAFRFCLDKSAKRGHISRAIFESQALALAHYPLEILLPHQEKIKDALLNLFNEIEYALAVSNGTGNYSKLKYRIERPQAALKEILGC